MFDLNLDGFASLGVLQESLPGGQTAFKASRNQISSLKKKQFSVCVIYSLVKNYSHLIFEQIIIIDYLMI